MEITINENIRIEFESSDNTVRIDDDYNDGLIVFSLEDWDKMVQVIQEQTK